MPPSKSSGQNDPKPSFGVESKQNKRAQSGSVDESDRVAMIPGAKDLGRRGEDGGSSQMTTDV